MENIQAGWMCGAFDNVMLEPFGVRASLPRALYLTLPPLRIFHRSPPLPPAAAAGLPARAVPPRYPCTRIARPYNRYHGRPDLLGRSGSFACTVGVTYGASITRRGATRAAFVPAAHR